MFVKYFFWHFVPVDGEWLGWGAWGECNVTCAGGVQMRNRTCAGRAAGGKECDGDSEDFQECNTQPCPGKCNIIFSITLSYLEIALPCRCDTGKN